MLWAILPIVTITHHGTANGESLLFIVLIISGITQILGVAIYLGHYEIMTGFSTMSEEERGQFDLKKVTSFTGMTFSLLAHIVFFTTLFSLSLIDVVGATILMAFMYIGTMIVAFMYLGLNTKFKL
jgi:hypothetical protein